MVATNGWLASGLKPGRVLILAHRRELIYQAADKINSVTGNYPEIEMGGLRASRHIQAAHSHVVVSSIQTQTSGRTCKNCNGSGTDPNFAGQCDDCRGQGTQMRMHRFDPFEFTLLVIDEAHRATSDGYRRVIQYYGQNPDLRILGVTATPDRSDGIALGSVFESVAFQYELPQAIEDGWLCPIRQEWITVGGLDFTKVRTTAGDLNEGDLEKILLEEEMLHGVVNPTLEIAGSRPTLFFATSVAHADRIAEIINRHKPGQAVAINGKTNEDLRKRDLIRYKNGDFQFLVNCGVFTEGFDEPRIAVIAVARPTKSRALYTQMVGRGTRPIVPPSQETAEERRQAIAEGIKPFVTVLDYVGNSGRHKLVTTLDILGGDYPPELLEKVKAKTQKEQPDGKGFDLKEQVEQVKTEEELLKKEAEERRAKVKADRVEYTRQNLDPFDIFDLKPSRGRYRGDDPRMTLTDRQLGLLDKNGVDISNLCTSDCKRLIAEICDRRAKGLCTLKQAKFLKRNGLDPNVSMKAASELIDGIIKGHTVRSG